jgi:YVTN family beta-propeller protein
MNRFVVLALLSLLTLVAVAVVTVQRARTYLPSGWRLSPAGEIAKIGDLAAGGEVSPNGEWIAFVTVGQGTHKLVIASAKDGKPVSELNLGLAWIGMDWFGDSRRIAVSGGTGNSIHLVDVSPTGTAQLGRTVKVANIANNRGWLAGLQLDNTEQHAYVAVSASDELRKVKLEDGSVVATTTFAPRSTPYQVRDSRYGLVVSLQGAQQVAIVDPDSMSVSRTLATGRHPNDVRIHKDRAFVACGNDDFVDVFDLYNGNREERIVTRPWPDAPPGSTPHALAITRDGEYLLVANSDNNCVAVIDVEMRGAAVVKGFVPTGAYPTAVAVLADDRTILTAAGKGYGTGPNGDLSNVDPIAPKGYPYIVLLMNGLLSRADFRDPKQLAQHTAEVRGLALYKPGIVRTPSSAPKAGTNPIPSALGDKSPIEHVLYIIKENRTYDQLFGDLRKNGQPYGNGEPKLTIFGENVAPNHRKLAMEYVLLDNFYVSGEVSVDGHHWSKGAYVPDFMQRTWPQQYSGKGSPRLPVELSMTPSGFIWDQVRKAGKSYRTYYYHTTDRRSDDWAAARARNERDYIAADIFIKEFKEFELKGNMPNFMVMALSEDHTTGTRPGTFTPQAAVGSNDLGLGKIVEAISKSKYWSKFAIFVLEDDAQNGPDHVDAHRSIGLVVSPYTRGTGKDSTHYTTNSFTRTIELILGLQPMSQFDAAATPLYRAFKSKPDLTPYAHAVPKTDLSARNPAATESKLLASIDFSEPDQLTLAQEIELNKAIWKSIKPNEPYPGAVRRFGMDVEDDD